MDQNIQARAHMKMTELQCSSQSNNHGCVYLTQTALPVRIVCRSLLVLLFEGGGRKRFGRNSAGERHIIMHIKLQQVEERVVYEIDRAIDILLHAEQQLQRSTGLVACREGNVG